MPYKNIVEVVSQLDDKSHSAKLFARIGNSEYTYGQLSKDVLKTLGYFKSSGIRKGQAVVLSTSHPYHMTVLYLAMLRYGIVTVLIDPDVPERRFDALCKQASVTGLIMDAELYAKRSIHKQDDRFQLKIRENTQNRTGLLAKLLKKEASNLPLEGINDYPRVLTEIIDHSSIDHPRAEDIAYIIFTSGTTSAPKGVMITHKNLFSHLDTLASAYKLAPNTRLLNILNLYHADGINQGPLLAAYHSITWFAPFSFDLTRLSDLFLSIYKYRITHFIAVPTILSLMNKYSEGYEDSFDTEEFEFIISVAAQLESDLWRTFENKFMTRIANVYGLTETVNGAVFNLPYDPNRKIGAIGRPLDCEVRIVPTDQQGNLQQGELWIKGTNVFAGYVADDNATKHVKHKGWLNTGDIASVDEDGNYFILGRTKNTISTGGFNIYPEQITEMINTHPEVVESICFGRKDVHFEERIAVAVVLSSGATTSTSELADYLSDKLERNQMPKSIYVLDELPKGLSGKVQLDKVKVLIDRKSSNNDLHIADDIIAIAAECFGRDPSEIDADANSSSLDGWDSMAHLDFITKIEARFGIEMNTADMMIMNSIKNAKRIIAQKLSQKK